MIRLRPGRRRILPVLALSLACVPLAGVPSPTVDDVVAALRADDDARAWTLLDELRAVGLGGAYDVRFLQGVLHLRAGEGADAARVFDELEASEGPTPALASGRALSAWAAGRPAEARTRLEHATRLWPEDPVVWANLGDVYRALAAHAYQRVRVLRRNADADADAGTPSPTAPILSAQPGILLSSTPAPAPTSIPPTGAPTRSADSAPPPSAVEAAAAAQAEAPDEPAAPVLSTAADEAVAAAEPAGTTGVRGDTTAPASSTPASDPADPPAPATAVEAAAAAQAEAPDEPAALAQSTGPDGSTPASGSPASSLPPSSPASPPPAPEATPELPLSAASVPLPSPEPLPAVPAPPSPEASVDPAGCFLAGPWPDAPPEEVLEWLRVRDAQVLSYQSRSSHYRVYLGPFEDRKEAVQTMISLKKDLGIGDVAWVPSGPLRDAVSLGVYLKQESVDRRLEALHALGLDPKVQPPRAGSWLLGSTSDLEALLTEWPGSFPDVPLAPERCPPSR